MKNLIYVVIAIIVIILLVVFLGGNGDSKPSLSGDTETFEVSMGETSGVEGLSINPIEVQEDSRCQEDVECIQAGTVVIKANLIVGDAEGINDVRIFQLGKISIVEDNAVLLSKVSPNTNSQNVINPEDYVFTFEVGEASENPEAN